MAQTTGGNRRPANHPPRWSPRPGVRLFRRPAVHWAMAAALAVLSATVVGHVTSEADARRAAFGDTRAVLVTTRSVAAGDPLVEATTLQDVPTAFVPDAAVSTAPRHSTSAHDMTAGTIVTATSVRRTVALGSAEVAVAVPTGPTTPVLSPGQQVLIVVHADPFTGVEPAQIEGGVHRVDDGQVTVTVQRADVEQLAAALNGNGVTLALVR